MASRLIIQNVTGTTPYDVYVCNVFDVLCEYVGVLSGITTGKVFYLSSTFDNAPIILVKLIDANGCEIKKNLTCDDNCTFQVILFEESGYPCLFTPTPSNTPTVTPTNTVTPTPSTTPTNTVTPTPTTIACDINISVILSPTPTPTPTTTPNTTNTPTPTNTITPTTTTTNTVTPTLTPTTTPTPTQAIVPSDPTLEIYYQGSSNTFFNPVPNSGDTFTQWTDSSASAHNANSIGGGTTKPQWWGGVQNGLGGVWFDGVNDGLSVNPLSDLSAKSGQTLVVVARTLNTGATQQYIQGGEDGNTGLDASYIRQSGGTYNLAIAGGFATGGTVNGSTHILSLVFSGDGVTNSDKLKFYIDGALQTLTFTQNVGTTTSSLIDYIFLGVSYTNVAAGTAQFYYNGFLFDVLAYSRTLSSAELTTLHQYLSNKWNITLN